MYPPMSSPTPPSEAFANTFAATFADTTVMPDDTTVMPDDEHELTDVDLTDLEGDAFEVGVKEVRRCMMASLFEREGQLKVALAEQALRAARAEHGKQMRRLVRIHARLGGAPNIHPDCGFRLMGPPPCGWCRKMAELSAEVKRVDDDAK